MAEQRHPEGPGIERTITLVDAVVAIAMTLLIVPLVDVATNEPAPADLHDLLTAYGDLTLAFVISFAVIFAFWRGHGALYHRLGSHQRREIRWTTSLHLGWLILVAFVPFPTALIGRDLNGVTGPVYLGTLLVLSALTFCLTLVVHREIGVPMGWDWLTPAVFAVSFVVSFFSPSTALYLLLVLIPVRILQPRISRRAG